MREPRRVHEQWTEEPEPLDEQPGTEAPGAEAEEPESQDVEEVGQRREHYVPL